MVSFKVCFCNAERSTDATARGIVKGQIRTQSMELPGKKYFKNKIFPVNLPTFKLN